MISLAAIAALALVGKILAVVIGIPVLFGVFVGIWIGRRFPREDRR